MSPVLLQSSKTWFCQNWQVLSCYFLNPDRACWAKTSCVESVSPDGKPANSATHGWTRKLELVKSLKSLIVASCKVQCDFFAVRLLAFKMLYSILGETYIFKTTNKNYWTYFQTSQPTKRPSTASEENKSKILTQLLPLGGNHLKLWLHGRRLGKSQTIEYPKGKIPWSYSNLLRKSAKRTSLIMPLACACVCSNRFI